MRPPPAAVPDLTDALGNGAIWCAAARRLERSGSSREAEQAWRTAVTLAPNEVEAWFSLGRILDRRDCEQAVECYERATALKPDLDAVWTALGWSCLRHERLRDAGRAFEEARARSPGFADAEAGLALVAFRSASTDVAWGLLSRHFERPTPKVAVALGEVGAHPSRAARALAVVERARDAAPADAGVWYARGALLDVAGRHDDAFASFERANGLLGCGFDPDLHARAVDALIRERPASALAGPPGHPGAHVALLVGAPRSGVGLVERLLAQDPRVRAGGARTELRKVAVELARLPRERTDGVALDAYGAAYADGLDPRFVHTDRGPQLEFHLGVAARILDGARVVWVRRDPADAAWSAFRTPYGDDRAFTRTFDGLSAYLRGHDRLMEHWKRALPLTIHEVRYEDLVRDPTRALAAVRRFLDLDDGRGRAGADASGVRPTSVGRSLPYDAWLGPIRDLRRAA